MSLEFLGLSHRIPGKIKNTVYTFEISSLVPGIYKFQKRVNYSDQRTDSLNPI